MSLEKVLLESLDVGSESDYRISGTVRMPEDVADTLKLSLSAVTRQLMCGRQTLKDRFAAMYLVCPKHGLAGCDCNQANRAKP